MIGSRRPGVFRIGAIAERFGIHPQTLRLYEREGLLRPVRTEGNTRLYDSDTIERLEIILTLTRDLGVNLAGVEVILHMKEKIESEVADAPAPPPKLRRSSEGGKPLWRRRERSDEGSALVDLVPCNNRIAIARIRAGGSCRRPPRARTAGGCPSRTKGGFLRPRARSPSGATRRPSHFGLSRTVSLGDGGAGGGDG